VKNRGNIIILILCQAAGLSGVAAVALLGGIIGAELAPDPALSTLPVAFSTIGVAIATVPTALLMKAIGRRLGFVSGAALAIAASLLAAFAVSRGSFFLFCLATLLIGVNSAIMQQYRFAAVESAGSSYASRAVSLVLLGGLIAAVLGPEVAQRTRTWLPAGLYVGSFVSVALLYVLALFLFLVFYRDVHAEEARVEGDERPLARIMAQPVFFVAVLSSAVAYGVMSFIMTATPIHMHTLQGFSLDQTTLVIQSHIVAMFLPSLFTGIILERLGIRRVLLAGVLFMLASAASALVSIHFLHYWITLVLLGVGWNFLFVGGTVLLTHAYRPAERFKAQAVNEFLVFASQSTASLSAGTALFLADWQFISITSLLPLLVVLVAILALRRHITPAPVEGLAG
jgi:MFS family permease